MLPKKQSIELAKSLKKDGKLKREAPTAAEKREAEKRAFENKVSQREKIVTLDVMFQAIRREPLGLDGQRAVLENMLRSTAGMDGSRLMAEWLGVQPDEPKKGRGLEQGCYQTAIMKAAEPMTLIDLQALTFVAYISREVKQGWGLAHRCGEVMKHLGVTVEAISKRAKEDVKDAIAAKKAKTEKPKSISKSKAAARNAGIGAADETRRDKVTKGKLVDSETGGKGDGATLFATLSKEDQAAAIAGGRATYVDCLGATPKRKAPERKEYDQRRVALHKAVKELIGKK